MVSQRQRLARKRYKEAHPELFPKPEPTPPKDPDKKKKKKSMFKRKKAGPEALQSTDRAPIKKHLKKHPLRVPGMKPGEGCFICKGKDHKAKECPKKSEWEKNKICLLCRRRGHSLKNCPDKADESLSKKLCYNCGDTGHSLSNCPCPLQGGGTKFASCFICKERGHLSKNCPQNTHGIYPKGGCCKTCGSVTHLVKDCPEKGKKVSTPENREDSAEDLARAEARKLISGDALEDDFGMVGTFGSKKDKSSSSDSNVRSQKKKGPKVVNFV